MREYQQYIGGEWVGSGELFDDLDPFRGTVMARIAAGTRADAARAVDAAAAAFPAWAELPPADKQALFLRAAIAAGVPGRGAGLGRIDLIVFS